MNWCAEVKRQLRPLACTAVKATLEEEYQNPMKLSVFYDHITQAAAQSAGRYSVEEILSRCSDAGIRGIDIEYSQLAENLDRICEALRYHYMEVASIYQMLDFRDHDFMSRAKEQLELADRLGVKRILLVPGFLERDEAKA